MRPITIEDLERLAAMMEWDAAMGRRQTKAGRSVREHTDAHSVTLHERCEARAAHLRERAETTHQLRDTTDLRRG